MALAAQSNMIHVFVALCDNVNQGIVPVPKMLGVGDDPKNNLYWGAAYGIKTYFSKKAPEWNFIGIQTNPKTEILERILFQHKTTGTYLLADAYNGNAIKSCIEDFLNAADRNYKSELNHNNQVLQFGGSSDLIAFIGHNGLMDFDVKMNYVHQTKQKPVQTIILACYSKHFFQSEIKKANAEPLLWTSHLMAPEAYTLKAAIDGWLNKESNSQIRERAAQAYHAYQKCGINGARNLLLTGF